MKRSADDAGCDRADDASRARGSVTRLMAGPSHVTMRGLESVLAEVRESGMPAASSRRTQARARASSANIHTPFGNTLQTCRLQLRERTLDLPVQAPLPMLWAAAQRRPFADLLAEAFQRTPGSWARPWRVIIYSDEVTPGNALKPDNRRKVQCVYWSFAELGSAALCHADAWFMMAAVRSTVVSELDGGMSHLFKVLLPLFFNAATHHLTESGVHLEINGQARVLHARLGIMVSDESAIRQVLLAKGAGGIKPCVCCKNVVATSSELHLHDATGYTLPLTSLDCERWDPQTDASVLAICQRLATARGELTAARFDELEKVLGFNWCQHSVHDVPEFSAISTLMWDWMHIYLVNGVFNQEIGRLMHLLHRHGATWQRLHEYMSRWTWPRSASTARALCDAKRARSYSEAQVFKCSASEGLSAYPVLHKFLVDVVQPTGVCAAAVNSGVRLCEALRLLHAINRGATVQPDALRAKISAHLEAYQAAYGTEGWLPKHHYSLHLPAMLAHHGTLVSCFTHERKHKVVKRYAQHHACTVSLEKGILEEITLQHLQDLELSMTKHGLQGPVDAPPKLTAFLHQQFPGEHPVLSASSMVQEGRTFSKGDVVQVCVEGSEAVGEIIFLASAGAHLRVCISLWEPVASTGERSTQYRVRSNPLVVDAAYLQEVLIYSRAADNATVILP